MSTTPEHVPPVSLSPMAPDAAERDAHRRSLIESDDGVVRGEDVEFVTRGVSDEERAAVLAVLLVLREEERDRVRLVARQEREPWARSQRTPEGIGELRHG